MRKELLNSRSVRLEGLGTFTMKACTQGHGVDQEEEVSPNQVAALRCLFTPNILVPQLSALPVLCFREWNSRKSVR